MKTEDQPLLIERFDHPLTQANDVLHSLKGGNVCIVQTDGRSDSHRLIEGQLGLKKILSDVCLPTWRPNTDCEPQVAFASPSVDGCWLTDPPIVVAQFCTAEGASSQDCTFVSSLSLWKALSARFSQNEISPLFDPDAFSVRIRSSEFRRPVFRKKHGAGMTRIACNFSARLDWHAVPSGMARPAFDFCREFVLQDSNQAIYRPKIGECVLVPNLLIMSGVMGTSDCGQIDHVWFGGAPTIELELGSFVP